MVISVSDFDGKQFHFTSIEKKNTYSSVRYEICDSADKILMHIIMQASIRCGW